MAEQIDQRAFLNAKVAEIQRIVSAMGWVLVVSKVTPEKAEVTIEFVAPPKKEE